MAWSSVTPDWVIAVSTLATMWALGINRGVGAKLRPLDKTCICGMVSCLEERFTTNCSSGFCFSLFFNNKASNFYLFLATCNVHIHALTLSHAQPKRSNMLVKCKMEEAATINYVKKMKWQHRFICIMNSERGMRNAQLEVIHLC